MMGRFASSTGVMIPRALEPAFILFNRDFSCIFSIAWQLKFGGVLLFRALENCITPTSCIEKMGFSGYLACIPVYITACHTHND
jgi:hypothetical protein